MKLEQQKLNRIPFLENCQDFCYVLHSMWYLIVGNN